MIGPLPEWRRRQFDDVRVGDVLDPGELLALAAEHGVTANLDTRVLDLFAAMAALGPGAEPEAGSEPEPGSEPEAEGGG